MRKSSRPAQRSKATGALSTAAKSSKHLLETSLLRNLTCGSQIFKERVGTELGDCRQYTSRFVRMEFRRGLLQRLADFCIQLHLPAVRCADDLLVEWANHFGDRDSKIAILLCRQLVPMGIDLTSPTSKTAVFRRVAQLALELETRVSDGTLQSTDGGHRCERAVPDLVTRATHPEEILQALIEFSERIQDRAYCRSRCNIDGFLQRRQAMVDRWVGDAEMVRGDARPAMRRSGPQAANAFDRGLEAWSCHDCEKLGDWIIALDCPQDLQVEHVDHVFDYLCPARGLAHRKHRPDRIEFTPPPDRAAEEPE